MHQLDSVSMLLKKKEQCNQISSRQHYEANLLELQCDLNSNMKEDNLLNIFKYQVSSVENSEVYVSAHESQNKCDCDCSSYAVLNWKTRIMKEQVHRKCELSISKTLHSEEWQNSQIVISDLSDRMRQDVYEKQNVKDDMSDSTMNVDQSESRTVRFADSILKSKEKQKTENNDESAVSKIKNVKLVDVLCRVTEQNSAQIVQKMLCVMISNITVENILTSESVTHKLMFKSEKFNVIIKISELNKINVNSIKTHQLSNVLYSLASPQAIVKVENECVSALLDFRAKVNLVQKSVLQKLNILYTVNIRLRLVNINEDEIMLWDICKNVKIQIDLISVLQFLLIIKSASQLMMLETLYASATSMITQSYSSDIINIKIISLQDSWKVKFQSTHLSPKMKYLL